MSGFLALFALMAASAWAQPGIGGTAIPQSAQGREPTNRQMDSAGRTLTGSMKDHEARGNPQDQAPAKSEPAGAVSADALRHPISAKAAKMIRRAQDDAHAGRHKKAIAELQDLLQKEPSSEPYARSLLGAEYLRTKQVAQAVEELTTAVRLLPHSAPNHANLGYALYLSGDRQKSVEQVRIAVSEDPHNPETRSLLEQLTRSEPGETAEK